MRTSFPLAISASTLLAAAVGIVALSSLARAQNAASPPPPMPGDPTATGPKLPPPADGDESLVGAEVLTRGPVHEAFASPTPLDPQPTPTVSKKPPEQIEEVPPDERPEGDNIVWIPGYWAWDDQRSDFLWVSGLYRNAPPKQTWVSGYWNQVAGGYQWTPGFWTSAAQGEVAYIEQPPPATLEAGPSSPAPSEEHFWIPGCWMHQDLKYVWRPGYWSVAQPDWIWMPARYVWCPGGYVFVPGYWDYLPASRGVLFAPVYFTQPIYYQPAFVYRPAVVINTSFVSANLFWRPASCQYYFGDYFALQYSNVGYRPWFSLNIGVGGRPCYDPFFTYYSWHNHRTDHDWLARSQQRYHTLQNDARARPPHTFASLQRSKSPGTRSNRDDVAIARTLREVKNDHNSTLKLRPVDRADREKFAKEDHQSRMLAKERREIEREADRGQSPAPFNHQRNGGGRPDDKSVVKMSDKTLRLPPIAPTSADGSARHHHENVGRDVAVAKDVAKQRDRSNASSPAHGSRTENAGSVQPTSTLAQKNYDRLTQKSLSRSPAATDNSPAGGGQFDSSRRDLGRTAVDQVGDTTEGAKKAVDRGRASVDLGLNKNSSGDERDRTTRRSSRSPEMESPRSNIDIAAQPPTVTNIRGKVKEELKSTRKALEDPETDDLAKRVRDVVRGTPDDVDDGKTSDKRSSPPSDPLSRTPLGPPSPQSNQRGTTQSESGGASSGTQPSHQNAFNNRHQGGHSAGNAAAGHELTDGSRPGASPLSRYDSLMQHGQTLSRGTARERPGTVNENGDVDPRKKKDPIGSIGFGATPQRYGTLRTNGSLGQTYGNSGTGGQQGLNGGGAPSALPHWQPAPLPRMQHLQRGGRSNSRSTNPVDRTYDPYRR